MAETAASGRVLQGRFHLGDELSGTKTVVTRRGRDELLQRDVAVTMPREPVPAEPAPGDPGRDRVETAREVLTDVDHPALPRVFDAGTDRDGPYLVTELFGGESLARRLGRGPLDRSAAARVGAVLADLLACLHARDLVHGPLPAEAVWIEDDGRVRVGGLGITRAPDDPVDRRAAVADDVASLGRLLGASAAPETHGAGGWRSLLDRMTAAAPADRPTPAEVRARLQVLVADTASRRAADDARTDGSATARHLAAVVPATAALRRPGRRWRSGRGGAPGRATAVLTAAVAVLVGIGALLVAPTLSTLGGGGEGDPGGAVADVRPTPARPAPASTADPTAPPTAAGETRQAEASEDPDRAQTETTEEPKDKGKVEAERRKGKGKGRPGNS